MCTTPGLRRRIDAHWPMASRHVALLQWSRCYHVPAALVCCTRHVAADHVAFGISFQPRILNPLPTEKLKKVGPIICSSNWWRNLKGTRSEPFLGYSGEKNMYFHGGPNFVKKLLVWFTISGLGHSLMSTNHSVTLQCLCLCSR